MSDDNPYLSQLQHRVLMTLTWVLLFLGLLAWFVLGANRPLDPVLVPAASLVASLR